MGCTFGRYCGLGRAEGPDAGMASQRESVWRSEAGNVGGHDVLGWREEQEPQRRQENNSQSRESARQVHQRGQGMGSPPIGLRVRCSGAAVGPERAAESDAGARGSKSSTFRKMTTKGRKEQPGEGGKEGERPRGKSVVRKEEGRGRSSEGGRCEAGAGSEAGPGVAVRRPERICTCWPPSFATGQSKVMVSEGAGSHTSVSESGVTFVRRRSRPL